MRRLIALRLAHRGLRTTDLRDVLGYDEVVQRAELAEATIRQHEDLLASIALYIRWRDVTRSLTTAQKDLFADAIERNAMTVHGPDGEDPCWWAAKLPSYTPRWWREDGVESP